MPFSGQASLLVSYLAFYDRFSRFDFLLFALCPALRRVRHRCGIHTMSFQVSLIFFGRRIELRDLFHKFRFLVELRHELLAVNFIQRRLQREQIHTETEAVSLDLYAHGRKCSREIIQ